MTDVRKLWSSDQLHLTSHWMILKASHRASLKAFAMVFALCYATSQSVCLGQSSSAITHDIAAPSKISITVRKDGTYTAESKTTDFVAYREIPDGWKVGQIFPPRVATITTTYVASNDDESTSLSVAVDDVSGRDIRRVAAFTDPGDSGKVVDGQFFVTTVHACCEMPALHRVRFLETGKLLFQSSGNTEFGAAAWAEIPNVFPNVARWAAFEPAGLFDSEDNQQVIGYITYGDLKGELSKVVIRSKAIPKGDAGQVATGTLRQNAAECGFVLWLVPGPDGKKPSRPANGECSHFPGGSHVSAELWDLAHQKAAPILSGFALEFSVLCRVYATIPIRNDRFDTSQGHIDPDLTVDAIAGSRR